MFNLRSYLLPQCSLSGFIVNARVYKEYRKSDATPAVFTWDHNAMKI